MLRNQPQEDGVNLQVACAEPASDDSLKKQAYPEEETVTQDIRAASVGTELHAAGAQETRFAGDPEVSQCEKWRDCIWVFSAFVVHCIDCHKMLQRRHRRGFVD